MPLYLLIGSEGSGKTSTFRDSGLDPVLLAGQPAEGMLLASSAPCSLWLARGAIFAEISGRAFSGDLRWTKLLRVLRAEPPMPWWRTLWGAPDQGLSLRGVIGFCDVKEFTGPSDVQVAERRIHLWRERLDTIGEVFSSEFPVFQVISKCDTIPFFADFFKRLPEPEAKQIFGCTLPFREREPRSQDLAFAEEEARRLTWSFRALYGAMAKRRTTHLAHEPDPQRRPGIYEFPRELNRIRRPLVQFLSNAFRPHSFRYGPQLRGYYLTGVREVEAAFVGAGETRLDWSLPQQNMGATRVFSAEATRIFRPDSSAVQTYSPAGLSKQTIFAADLFQKVIVIDQPVRRALRVDARVERYRRVFYAAVCAVCGFLLFAFALSWLGNRKFLSEVEGAASAESQQKGNVPTLAELNPLEDFRVQVARLTEYDRHAPPLGLRWGLYSGGSITADARAAYFRRFQQLILNQLNDAMVARLGALPNPGPNNPYGPAYGMLKAHLMISCCCPAEPAFLSGTLKQVREETGMGAGSEERALIDRQIEFYADELPYGNPTRLTENAAARDRARQYLRNVRGIEQIYGSILANAEKTLTKRQRLADLAPDYAKVLYGPAELSAAFTHDGWNFVEKASKQSNAAALGEPCVMGETSSPVAGRVQEAELAQAIQSRFIRDYIGQWRRFVAGFSVLRYSGPGDAARKLDILAGHRSPLLAVLAMTANQTDFSPASDQQTLLESKVPAIHKIFTAGKKAEAAADKAAGLHNVNTPIDITRSFQPVHWVVPPNSDTWVAERNRAYIDALSQLRNSMEDIERTAANPDPSVHQAASQNYEKAIDAAQQIARGFKPVGVDGMDAVVQRLLEEPITLAKPFIISDMDKAAAGKVNGEARAFCASLRSTTVKYPFQPGSSDEVSLQELATSFAPGIGAIWKFQAKSLAEFTVKDGTQWKAKDPAKKPQITLATLAFLNRAQAIADVFYPAGATQPQLSYTLRPKLDSSFKDSTLELDIDGRAYQWTSSLQKQFTWPAAADTKDLGAVARVRAGALTIPVASRGGLWGIFRIMDDAEPRPLLARTVEWKYLRGGDGRLEAIQPAPVRVEIVEFPGGADVFNPKFFDLQCPLKAVE